MKKYLIKNLFILTIVSLLSLPILTFAASSFICPSGMSISDCQKQKLGEVYGKSFKNAEADAITSLTISEKIGLIVSYALAFLGVIFLVLTVYSGFQWMTAGGNEEKITEARKRLTNAVIGLTIILSAYSITWFVVNKLQDTVEPPITVAVCATNPQEMHNYSCVPIGDCELNPNNQIVQGDCQDTQECCEYSSPE